MTTESEIETSEIIRRHVPILAETSSVIADPLVRNMGTLGGNLAHADPTNDHPAAILTLDAEIELAGPRSIRRVAADDFFRDLFTTALEADEVLASIRVRPAGPGSGWAYVKAERQVGDFAVVAAAVRLEIRDGAHRGRADRVDQRWPGRAPSDRCGGLPRRPGTVGRGVSRGRSGGDRGPLAVERATG